jgi:23S rRNA pseudouridine1911/1915/1917 synthase
VPFEIAHEDGDLLVVSKPAGVVTQPGKGHLRDALLNGVFALHGKTLQNLGKKRDFGLLHRLDKGTSGLVAIALTAEAYDGLRAQFAARTVGKTYVALVHGTPNPPQGVERTPLREVRRKGRKRVEPGKHSHAEPAVTRYTTSVRARGIALVECVIETGRLHQIRAHMACRGAPVVGDRDYGARSPARTKADDVFRKAVGEREALGLHAALLTVKHPRTGKQLELRAPLPEPLQRYLTQMSIACPRRWR